MLGTVPVIVDVPVPGAGIGFGLKVITLDFVDKVTAELKPFSAAVVIVAVRVPPSSTVITLGDIPMAKKGDGGARRALINPDLFGLPHPLAKS